MQFSVKALGLGCTTEERRQTDQELFLITEIQYLTHTV